LEQIRRTLKEIKEKRKLSKDGVKMMENFIKRHKMTNLRRDSIDQVMHIAEVARRNDPGRAPGRGRDRQMSTWR